MLNKISELPLLTQCPGAVYLKSMDGVFLNGSQTSNIIYQPSYNKKHTLECYPCKAEAEAINANDLKVIKTQSTLTFTEVVTDSSNKKHYFLSQKNIITQ